MGWDGNKYKIGANTRLIEYPFLSEGERHHEKQASSTMPNSWGRPTI